MSRLAATARWLQRSPGSLLAAVILVALGVLLRSAAEPSDCPETGELLFLLPIVLSALLGGLRAGLLATALVLPVAVVLEPGAQRAAGQADLSSFEWLLLLVTGVAASASAEVLHASRRRLQAREARLREQVISGEGMARVVASTPGAIFAGRMMPDGGASIPFAGPRLGAILGIDAGVLASDAQLVFEGMHPEDRARVREEILTSARHLTAWHGEFRMVRPGGAIAWVEGRAEPEREPDGATLWHGFLEDVTARRNDEAALRQAREVTQLLIEQAPVSIAILDRDMVYLAASHRWLADYGVRDLVGRSHYEVFPDIPERWREIHRACLAGEVRRCEEDPWDRADGRRTWLRWFIHPWRDGHGAIGGIIIFTEDITQRKEDEEALLEKEERLAAVVESAMDGIITVDEQQRVELMNAAAERMFGRRAGEMLGRKVSELMPERYRDHHAGLVRAFGSEGAHPRSMQKSGTLRGLRASGEEFPIEASISRARVGDRQLYTVILRDISARLALEEQLRQTQKMESIGQLAGGVAHDFNNMLTVVLSCADALALGHAGDEETLDLVRDIQLASRRAVALTRQLLAFTRQEVVDPRVLDLGEVARDTEKMLRRLIGEHIELSVATMLAPPVRVDPGQWTQVLLNLAVNARDAMPAGGRLSVETRGVELRDGDRPGIPGGRFAELRVSDTGTGMSEEVRSRIFEPFFTTKGRGKGTGLGLSVVYGIVQQSGGHVEVASAPGRGTTFSILLPAAREAGATATDADRPGSRGGSESILLVEDDEGVRRIASRALSGAGYRVTTATDGVDALRIIDGHPEAYDLVLTDVVMPNMGGPELVAAVLERRPEMKVIFSSGYLDDAVVRAGIERSDTAFLQKPYDPDVLLARVRERLDQ